MHRTISTLLILSVVAAGQVNNTPKHYVWALDAGDQASPTPIIRVYSPSGAEVLTVNVPGSGPTRALAFDTAANAYVCRGSLVHQLDSMGVPTGVTLSPPSGANNSQDVCQLPDGNIAVSWGSSAAASAIATYDATGALLSAFTDPALDHPRRITTSSDANSTLLYVANRGSAEIRVLDLGAMPPTFTVLTSLSSMNIGPVGLCYDNADDRLWVVSSWGNANEIGTISLANPTYATSFTYPPLGLPGLTSPAGVSFDRYRNLYVAGRDKNGGGPGVYVFETDPSFSPAPLSYWPRVGTTPVNVIDVAPQPTDTAVCAPTEVGPNGPINVLAMGRLNRVTFSNPATPGAIYAAALSLQWRQGSCAVPFRPGVVDPFLLPDVRGLPLETVSSFYFGSVAVAAPGPSPFPAPPGEINDLSLVGIDISGFFGALDATGFAEGWVNMSNFLDPGQVLSYMGMPLNGLQLELAFVTFDLSEPSMFGYVSQPLCLVLRNPAASPIMPIGCP